uniref:EOG090X07S9 n=1 Tax=Daphnia pulicaria TaxID=35523 RepID=A0A4Y7MXZ7_9CRUS|nr:EOG090X07S9 [Daphnia pulicaria]
MNPRIFQDEPVASLTDVSLVDMSARSSSNEIANEPQNESSPLVGEIDAEGNSSILEGRIIELLSLLVDSGVLRSFGWPDYSADTILQSVLVKCGKGKKLNKPVSISKYRQSYSSVAEPPGFSPLMQEQNIPIDIQTSKLLDWVISRRHCTKTWPQQITLVREKINSAIQDMPEHKGITKLLTGTYINYFHCLQIVEILKETEADTRSLFGRYGSQRMKDWQEVVRLYEKDNVYLAEAAQILMRNVAYEIPGIKKSITKCEQVQHESEKKENECVKNAQDFRDKYKSLSNQLGIEGKNIKNELADLLCSLPEMYKDVAQQGRKTKEAAAFYREFLGQMITGNSEVSCLPVLQYIIENGNTTVYEWRYGEPPLRIEEPSVLVAEPEAPTTTDDAIDFGDAAIDLGSDDVELETGDIDWGQIDMLPDAHEATIDFSTTEDAELGIVVQEAGVEGGVARDIEALTVLDYHKTRNMFIDDLVELEAFLKQRLMEIQATSKESKGFSFTQTHSSTEKSPQQLEEMLSQVLSTIDAINRPKLKNLALIRESPRYVDRVANSLQQHLRLADKMEANRMILAERRRSAAAEQVGLQPTLKKLIERTKELQADLEKNISKKYNNRPVHITGGVTSL